MTQHHRGGCQCGNVQYRASGPAKVSALCHCSMCRRAHAAPAVGWALFDSSQVTFTKGEPKQFESSPDAQRGFCADCGTQLCFEANYLPGMIDISIGSLDDPNAISPSLHYWHEQHLTWFEVSDDLKRYDQWPPLGEE